MKPYRLPVTCPQCGGPIEHAADGTSDGLRAVVVCRCTPCRRDWLITATISPAVSQVMPRRDPPQTARHGTPTMYRYGCKCDACRAAHARNAREKRAKVTVG